MKHIQVRVDDSLYMRLQRVLEQRSQTTQKLLRNWIVDYVEEAEEESDGELRTQATQGADAEEPEQA